jgi:4-hydroxy-3-methylbut-2-enyl diphosphate reductase
MSNTENMSDSDKSTQDQSAQPHDCSDGQRPGQECNIEAAGAETAEDSASAKDQDFSAQLESYEKSMPRLETGQYMKGHVVKVDKDGVLVDVGNKTEGYIPLNQLSHKSFSDPSEIVSPGDEIDVVVLKVDSGEGALILSKKKADLESSWHKVVEAFEQGGTLTGTCIDQVKGGLIVDLGLRGFIPASQVDLRPVKDLSEFVGEALAFKVLEIDRARRKVVLSRKKALEEERVRLKSDTLKDLYEGQIITGTVARITDFGAFVNLGGVDGLIHVSELSWKRVNHPSEVVRIGQQVDVFILRLDKKKERISLSLRAATPDPWSTIEEKIQPGTLVKGTVTKFAKNYVFVELLDGLEGLIPLTELADDKLVKPDEVLKVGEVVTCKVLEIKSSERRIKLSVRQAAHDAERAETQKFIGSQSSGSSFTLGDLLKTKGRQQQDTLKQIKEEGLAITREEQAAREVSKVAGEAESPAE